MAWLGVCMGMCLGVSQGEINDGIPKNLTGVGVDEQLDAEIPTDVVFSDEQGRQVSFAKLLEEGKPIILTLNYSDCPGLCITQLNGLTEGINNVTALKLGEDFRMVSLSIDPSESVSKAAATKARYTGSLEKRHKMEGWSFWVGPERNIKAIANAVGFRYTYDSKNKQFNHSAAAIFISPKGKITRYLYEVGFIRGETLRMALIECGEGKIGSSFDAFVLWCSHYNPNENRYSASARKLLSVFAAGFVLLGLVGLIPYWLTKMKQRELLQDQLPSSSSSAANQADPERMEDEPGGETIRRVPPN